MALVLSHTPGEWDGTFAVTAEFMIADLLADGELRVIVDGESHMLTGYVNGFLRYADGGKTRLIDVNNISIP